MERTTFRIADVPICLETAHPLEIEPAFREYRSEQNPKAILCSFEERANLPQPGGTVLFRDGMHRIVWEQGKARQYFYIPYAYAPPQEQRCPDAVQELDGSFRIFYRPEAQHYFDTAFGCFNALKLERLLIGTGTILLHASFLEWNGSGIAFTAPSGTGKSTQAALWEKYAGAFTVNGDRMAIRRQNGICGFGVPIAGSSQIFWNRRLPMKAIVLLEQGKDNAVFQEQPAKALPFLLRQTTVNRWDSVFMGAALDTLQDVLQNVPCFRLMARPDEGAVAALQQKLGKL